MRTVILGSGVIGVTTAWQLAKEGHEVVVIDRQPVAANETSYANAGLVAPGHALTWSSPRAPKILLKSLFQDDQALRLKLSVDSRLWSWCLKFLRNCTSDRARRNTLRKLKLCVYSQRALQELVAETGVEYDGVRKGLLYVYRDEASLQRGIANMTILRDAGQRMEMLDRAGVAKVEPAFESSRAPVAGGLYCPDDEQGDSNKFTCGLAERLKARGVEFRFSTTVTGFETSGDKIDKVVTDKDAIVADNVVLALGSFSPIVGRKLGLRLPVYPIKGYSVTLPVDGSNATPEVDQSPGFISGSGFLLAHLRVVLPPTLSRAKPIFDMHSRLMQAVQCMFESCSVEHGPTQPKRRSEGSPVKRGLFETARAPFDNFRLGVAAQLQP